MRSSSPPRPERQHVAVCRAYALIEVVVTLAVVLAILVICLQFVTNVEGVWKTEATDPFAAAAEGFDALARNLGAATLEPYQDYADTSGAFRTNSTEAFIPDHPARRSDLAFVCGPAAGTNGLLNASGRLTAGDAVFFTQPAGYTQTEANSGLGRLLNAVGYFVEFGPAANVPAFLPANLQRWRWRLKETEQPSESLQIYALPTTPAWIGQAVAAAAPTSIAMENCAALLVLPERVAGDTNAVLSPDFRYDSRDATQPLTRHQLPPRLRLVLVALDEASAQLLAVRNGTNAPALVPATLFQQSAQLDGDLATLDGLLTAQKIGHRTYQREIIVEGAAWSNTLSQ